MFNLHFVLWILLGPMFFLAAGAVSAQNYPTRAIRIITSPTGGGSALVARLLAHELAGPLGQPVLVDNRGTNVASEMVLRAAPDGYAFLSVADSLWIGGLLEKRSYDPVRDFLPVSMVTRVPTVVAMHPSVPVKSVKELIALAKARPGDLNFASASPGSASHLSGELFKIMANVNIVHIPYKGSGVAIVDLIGGQVQLMFVSAGSAAPYAKSGRLRTLAVTSLKPSALLPDLPTVASSGLPGYESVANFGLFAPAKTPEAIINRMSQEIVRVLDNPEVKEKFLKSGIEASASSPQEFAALIKSEIIKWGKVIDAAGIGIK